MDLSKLGEILGKLHWRSIFWVVVSSFLLATLVSTVIVPLLMPDNAKSKVSRSKSKVRVGNASVASLNKKAMEAILDRNIFNSAKDDSEELESEVPTNSEQIVKSNLPLELMGTVFSGDPYSGIATIKNKKKNTINSFLVGDTLLENAELIEILREKIILQRGEIKEYVAIDKKVLVRKRRRGGKKKPSAGPKIAPIATEPPPAKFSEEGFERAGAEIKITEGYRKKMLTQDLKKILQDAKATPNMVNGELRGFKLTRIRKDSIYEKAGLQNEDIIEEVNGVPLSDASMAIRHLNSLRNEREIEIRVKRSGQVMNFNFQVE